jgi:outer membrane protein assembly factor BamB
MESKPAVEPPPQPAAETAAPAAPTARREPPPEAPREPAPRERAAERPSPAAPPRPAPRRPAAPAPQAAPAPKAVPKLLHPEQFVWAFPDVPPADGNATPLRNAPAVDNEGRIFIHMNQRLFGMVEDNGQPKILWEYVTGSRAPGNVVLGPDDTLRVHCCDGYLHCVATASGKQTWAPASVGEPLGYAVPVVDAQGNTWTSAPGGGLVMVDSHGRVQKPGPYFRSRQKFDSPGIISRGVLYIGSEHAYVFAIELGPDRGTNLWNHAVEQGYTGGYVRSAPVMSEDGILVVAATDENLYGFGPGGGLAWKTQAPGQMLGSLVADRAGHLYVGISQSPRGSQPRGSLICLDGNSHKIRWEYRAAGPVESTPVIGNDDVIYFGDNAGVIHAIDFHGKALWKAEIGSPIRSAGTIFAPERLAFGTDSEMLVILRCSSQGLAEGGWPKVGRTLAQSPTV